MNQLYRVWVYENGRLSFMSRAMHYDAASLCSELEQGKLEDRYPGLEYDWDAGVYRAVGNVVATIEVKEV